MFKLLKYNFRESSRILTPGLAIIFILNIFSYDIFETIQNEWLSFLLVLINLIVLGIVVFHLGTSFIREFNEDRRFLTFTLPINGKMLILAKLFNTTIWLIILGLVELLSATILAFRMDSLDFNNFNFDFDFDMFNINVKHVIAILIFTLFIVLAMYIYIMLSGYFVETLGRIIYRGKAKFIQILISATLWITQFIIFVNITEKVSSAIPIYYNVLEGKFSSLEESAYMATQGAFVFDNLNITILIVTALVSAAYFFGMAYLIDKKVDL